MNLITRYKAGWLIKPRSDKPRSALRPSLDGQYVNLLFPHSTDGSLKELDAWLSDHPLAQMVQIRNLPTDRRTLRGLTEVCDRHQVAILFRPRRNETHPTETRQ